MWTVTHKACEHGCYDCKEGTLVATAKLPPFDPELLGNMVFALHEDGTRFMNITLRDICTWASELPWDGAPDPSLWFTVPNNLLLPGMKVAYLNGWELFQFFDEHVPPAEWHRYP